MTLGPTEVTGMTEYGSTEAHWNMEAEHRTTVLETKDTGGVKH